MASSRATIYLIQAARINGHDPYVYLEDVLEQLPTEWASRIERLLPDLWMVCSLASYSGFFCTPIERVRVPLASPIAFR